MVQIPGLTPNMRFVDPRSGLVTAQALNFWGQVVGSIQASLTTLASQQAQLTAQQAALAAQQAALTAQEALLAAQVASLASVLAGTTAVALTSDANTWTALQTFSVEPTAPGYKVSGVQVVGAQQPAITPLAGGATLAQVITFANQINAQLAAHGLFA